MRATLGRKTGSGTYLFVFGDCRGDFLGGRASGFAGEELLDVATAATTSAMASARTICGDVLERRKAGLSLRVTVIAFGMVSAEDATRQNTPGTEPLPSKPPQRDWDTAGRPAGCAHCAACKAPRRAYQ